jgi:hypothetical protein
VRVRWRWGCTACPGREGSGDLSRSSTSRRLPHTPAPLLLALLLALQLVALLLALLLALQPVALLLALLLAALLLAALLAALLAELCWSKWNHYK